MDHILICLFQRGGADGLNMVVPHGEAAYYAARPAIAIAAPRPGSPATAIELDGFFGLHPALGDLKEIYDARQLAIVHACGSPDATRSHFDAQANLERGLISDHSETRGWLGRHLAATAGTSDSPFRAIGFGALLQPSLRGSAAVAVRDLTQFTLRAKPTDLPRIRAAHGEIYRGEGLLAGAGQQTLAALALLEKLNPGQYKPADGARYPESPYGLALQQIAQLIKADVGLQVACADIGDWDTHVNQGGSEGEFAANLAEFGAGLHALYADLAAYHSRITVVTMSEFGRRLTENGGGGTDHGHGNAMFVMGGGLAGGKVYGSWPGLQAEQLDGPGDLAITTDIRDILGEIAQKRLGNPDLDGLFPGYNAFQFRGLVP
ncbi:MAG: DUF1501 domain-containing protein [Roseiflexaceae bacterium]|nr:DUF1501 domain-containing protein [Roseiflexaceae bacterium]